MLNPRGTDVFRPFPSTPQPFVPQRTPHRTLAGVPGRAGRQAGWARANIRTSLEPLNLNTV